tara:strand:- start:450 stop:629 length:180 start_codon:yes stop_codon:yes gene_type:complete
MTPPVEVVRNTKVETDRLCVADVQITVRFGRKACSNFLAATTVQIIGDYIANEISDFGS